VALIAASVVTFVWQMSLGEAGNQVVFGLGAIPAVVLGSRDLSPDLVMVPSALTLLTSMFLHGGFMHLAGNMLYLWIFGDNVEDSMGHGRFLVFYVLCGLIASGAHIASNVDSAVPMIGASGAISGVLGAYLVLHPKARVLTLVGYFAIRLPAFAVLGIWIGLQVFNVAAAGGGGGGIAWWAHIGGFVAGAVLIIPFRHRSATLLDGWRRGGGPQGTPVSGGKPKPRRSRIPPSGGK
jgi:membrane associated rhomboid family serine protease